MTFLKLHLPHHAASAKVSPTAPPSDNGPNIPPASPLMTAAPPTSPAADEHFKAHVDLQGPSTWKKSVSVPSRLSTRDAVPANRPLSRDDNDTQLAIHLGQQRSVPASPNTNTHRHHPYNHYWSSAILSPPLSRDMLGRRSLSPVRRHSTTHYAESSTASHSSHASPDRKSESHHHSLREHFVGDEILLQTPVPLYAVPQSPGSSSPPRSGYHSRNASTDIRNRSVLRLPTSPPPPPPLPPLLPSVANSANVRAQTLHASLPSTHSPGLGPDSPRRKSEITLRKISEMASAIGSTRSLNSDTTQHQQHRRHHHFRSQFATPTSPPSSCPSSPSSNPNSSIPSHSPYLSANTPPPPSMIESTSSPAPDATSPRQSVPLQGSHVPPLDEVVVDNNGVSKDLGASVSHRSETESMHSSSVKTRVETATDLFLIKRYFIVRLAEALSVFGAPAYRIEHVLLTVAEAISMNATFATLPNMILLTIEAPPPPPCPACTSHGYHTAGPTTETLTLPTRQGYDMGRLYVTIQLTLLLAARQVSLEEAIDRLDELIAEPVPTIPDYEYGRHRWWWCRDYPQSLLTIVSCTSIAPLAFSGSWTDMFCALLLSTLVQVLCRIGRYVKAVGLISDPLAAVLCGFLGSGMVVWVPRIGQALNVPGGLAVCYRTITLSGVLDQLPGLILCLSMVDMGSGHLISGTTRLMHGVLKALVLALGLIIGTNAYLAVFANTPYATEFTTSCAGVLPVSKRDHWILVANVLLFLMVAANSASMRAAPRQFPIMMLTGAMAFWIGDAFDSIGMGYDASSLLTAFVIGIVSNGYSRLTGCPAIAPLLSGVLLLVPGSIGVRRTMAALDPTNFGAGSGFAIDFIVIAAWLSIGILGSRVLPPIENHLKPKVIKMLWDIKRANGVDSRSVYASTIGSRNETQARKRRPSNGSSSSSASMYSSTSSLGPEAERANANVTPVPLVAEIPPARPQALYVQAPQPLLSAYNTPKQATRAQSSAHTNRIPTTSSQFPPPRPTSPLHATARASKSSAAARLASAQKTVAARMVTGSHEFEQPLFASNPSCSGSLEPLHTSSEQHRDEMGSSARGRLGTIMSIDQAFRSMFSRGGRGSRTATTESHGVTHHEQVDEDEERAVAEPQVTIEMSVPMNASEAVRDDARLN